MTKRIRSGLPEASITVLSSWLKEEFQSFGGGELGLQLVRNVSDLRSYRSGTGEQRPSDTDLVEGSRTKDSTAFPRIHMTIGRLGLDGNRAGFKKNRAVGGVIKGRDTYAGEAYIEDVRPVVMDIGLTFFSDSIEDVLIFSTALFHYAPKIGLNVEDIETGFNFEIGLNIEGELTIPQADTSNPGDPFTFETMISLNTHMGTSTRQRLIRSIRVSAAAGGATEPERLFDIDDLPTRTDVLFNYYDVFDRKSYHYKGDYKEVNR